MSGQKDVGAAAARRPGTVSGREMAVEAWSSGWPVLAALLPAAAAGTFHFGLPALSVMGGAAGGCLALRALSVAAVGRGRSLAPGRAALVGLLIGMSLPASSPPWLILAGCAVGMLCGTGVRGVLGPARPFMPAWPRICSAGTRCLPRCSSRRTRPAPRGPRAEG